MAKTGILSFFTREAATSSWVLKGLEAHRATAAPPALSVCIRVAVSVVTCRQALRRIPLSGFSFANRWRIRLSTGMFWAAHSIRSCPSLASLKSLTSYFIRGYLPPWVVAQT